jgi:hypothetical protein
MRFTLAVAPLIAAFVLGACAPVDAPADEGGVVKESVVISMSRTACFGFCPVYTVSITGAGEVTYVGRQFVNVVGEQHGAASRADVSELLAHFDAVGFERLRDEYRAQVTDLPTTTIVLQRGGRRKSVLDYGGVGAGMPETVRDLQVEIDRVAGTARWVLRDGQPVRDRPEH